MDKDAIAELLKGSVETISTGLSALDDAALAAVLEAERARGNRTTLIAAIEREQATRAEAAANAGGAGKEKDSASTGSARAGWAGDF
jgi:hypothetical protein